MSEPATHPIQCEMNRSGSGQCPVAVTMLAYEVYTHCFGAQEAIVTGGCRGGFGVGELIAFLYARNFPRSEWRARVEEALRSTKRPRPAGSTVIGYVLLIAFIVLMAVTPPREP